MRPDSSTRISSASTIVDSRCAIVSVVWLRAIARSSAWIAFSDARIERARRLVEDQDARRLEDRAGDGDTLLLAAGELEAALADRRRVALGQSGDEVVDLRQPRRRDDLVVRRARLAVARCCTRSLSLNSTVSCGTMPIAARRLACCTSRMSWPSIVMRPPVDVVEAVEQPRQRRLARAGRTDDGDRASGGNRERHVEQDLPIGLVGEIDVLEAHFARRRTASGGAPGLSSTSAFSSIKPNRRSMSASACLISR